MSPSSVGDVVKTREALQELVQTEGWHLFLQHVKAEWVNEGYAQRMGVALQTSDHVAAQVVHATAYGIQRICQWPTDQLRDLKGLVDE